MTIFMPSGSRRPRLALSVLLASALLASASIGFPAAAEAPSREVTLATELLVAPSGERTVRQLVQDPRTGRWLPVADSDLAGAEFATLPPESGPPGPGPTAQQPNLDQLGVLISDRWPGGGFGENGRQTITFRKGADIRNPQRNFVRNTANRFVNRNLGHRGVPDASASNQRNVRFRPPSAFQGGEAEARDQYNRDGINEIALDEDNVLFFGFISNPHDPEEDPIIRAIRFSTGTCTMTGGRFFCPLFLVEGDIHFRARQTIMQRGEEVTLRGFFDDLDLATRRELIIAMVKFVQGHFSDAWAHSFQGGNRREVGPQATNRFGSRTWRESRDGDSLLYSNLDPEENGPTGAPSVRPRRNSVIDVNDLEPPTLRQTDTPGQALFRHNQFAETNLRGYNRRRQIVVEIFEGRNRNNASRILRLAGSAPNRALTLNDGRPGEAAYRVSHLSITDARDWETLRDRIVDNGRRNARANGVRWDRVLVVNVCVTGHVRDGGGGQRTVCQPYRYAYDIPDGGL